MLTKKETKKVDHLLEAAQDATVLNQPEKAETFLRIVDRYLNRSYANQK